MILKQNVLKEKKVISIIAFCVSCVLWIIPVLLILFDKDTTDKMNGILLLSLFFFPMILLAILSDLQDWEWHCVYGDRIETRCIYGIKNTVYFASVLHIEELPIRITPRGNDYVFYMLNDGRKNNGNVLDFNSCYNRKKYNLRIYKTPELEEFIKNHPVLKNLPIKEISK